MNYNEEVQITVLARAALRRPVVSSKIIFIKRAWHNLKMLPHLSPLGSSLSLMRAFKWGTVWPCTLALFYGRGGSDYPLSHIYCCHLDGDKDNWLKTWWQYSFGVSWSLDKPYFDILI